MEDIARSTYPMRLCVGLQTQAGRMAQNGYHDLESSFSVGVDQSPGDR